MAMLLETKKYQATLTNAGRAGWSVIFRHPVVVNPATGQPPLRIKRGLGTQLEEEAKSMANELNALLADPSYWSLAARSAAGSRFSDKAVKIFFDPMEPEELDYPAMREKYIRLPTDEDGYKRVLIIGTTGAGKTTMLRQIIGTNPQSERFPSVSTSRCTIADTEIVISEGLYKSVVTFSPQEEIREAADECLAAAILAAYRKSPDDEIIRKLLNHVDLRFRFSYVLGTGVRAEDDERGDVADENSSATQEGADEFTAANLEGTNEVIARLVQQVKRIAEKHGDSLRRDLVRTEVDQRVADELFEEELDKLLREDEEFQEAGDQMMQEIRQRFQMLDSQCIETTRQDWPIVWHWQTDDRRAFLKQIALFSGNHYKLFGQLLTPLVNGIRVSGPFVPQWRGDSPKLVLIDGEGLGHSPETSSSIPSSVIQRFDTVDAIVLVDNAQQPMQAAPVAALRAVLSSGNVGKLVFAFTHFDQIQAPNFQTLKDRENHVRGTVENAIRFIGNQLGPRAERDLRQRIETACFYLERMNEWLDLTKKVGNRAAQALNKLVDVIFSMGKRVAPTEASPVYDRLNLAMAVRDAVATFHEDWRGLLGLANTPRTEKVHWAKVKALNRRLAEGWAEEYDGLAPVGSLWKELREQVYRLINSPIEWRGPRLTDEETREVLNRFANEVSERLGILVRQRIRFERVQKWQTAYSFSGLGSTFSRARFISSDIYMTAAPIPDATPSPDGNSFLREVIRAVEDAASTCKATLH